MPEENTSGSDQQIDLASTAQADSQGNGSTGAGTAPDSYDDLKADPRVQKYVSDLHSRTVQHIPKEYRTPDQFGKLLQAHRQWEGLQKDPGYQAFQAGRQTNRGGQQEPQSPFHAKILETLESDFGPMDGQRKKFLGRMIDGIADALESRVASKHVKPIMDHLGEQGINAELEQVRKMDRYNDVQGAMKQVLEQNNYQISFETAYKIAMHDLTDKERKALKVKETQGDGDGEETQKKRVTSGERPSGSGAGSTKQGSFKNAKGATEAAMRELRAKGIM